MALVSPLYAASGAPTNAQGGASTSVAVTHTAAIQLGDVLVAHIGWADNTTTVTVTDSIGTVYHATTSQFLTNAGTVQLFWGFATQAAAASSNVVTANLSASISTASIGVAGARVGGGVNAWRIGATKQATGTSATPTATLTTTGNNSIVVSGNAVQNTTTAAGGGSTLWGVDGNGNGLSFDILTAVSTVSPTFTQTSGAWAMSSMELVPLFAAQAKPWTRSFMGPLNMGPWSPLQSLAAFPPLPAPPPPPPQETRIPSLFAFGPLKMGPWTPTKVFSADAPFKSNAFALSVTGAATATDNVVVTRGMVEAIAGVASVTDAIIVARALSIAISGHAAVTDALLVVRAMAVAIAGQASFTDALAVTRHFAVAIAGNASLTDALNIFHQYAIALAPSFAQGPMRQGPWKPRTGPSPAFPASTKLFQLAVSGAATIADAFIVARAMSDSIAGSAAVTDALAVKRALADSIAGHAAVADALAVRRQLAVAISGAASVADAMALVKIFALSVAGQASATDALAVIRGAALSVPGHASLVDALAVIRKFSDSVTGQSSVVDALAVQRHMQVSATGHSSVVAQFTIPTFAVNFAVAVAAGAHVTAAESVVRAMAAGLSPRAVLAVSMAVLRTYGVNVSASAIVVWALFGNPNFVVVSTYSQPCIKITLSTRMQDYLPGVGIRSFATFVDLTGSPVDPLNPLVTVRWPDGTRTNPTPVRDSLGFWHADFLPASPMPSNVATIRWQASGPQVLQNGAAEEKFFIDPTDA